MNRRYDIFKTMIGIITIGLLILQSYGMAHNRFSWWYIPVSMILLILVVKSVSFMRGWERIWMFVITLFSTIPFNVKMEVNIVLPDALSLIRERNGT